MAMMMMMYKEHDVYISMREKRKLQTALERKKPTIRITVHPTHVAGSDRAKLLLTKRQISKLEKGKKNVSISMSKRQLQSNVKYEGGFLSVLASLAGKVLPTVLAGLSSGLLSGLVERAVKGGDGLYLHKDGHCYKAEPVEGNGLYLSPHQALTQGNGLFLKHGDNIYDGKGLLLGPNSPFKKIPILGLIL